MRSHRTDGVSLVFGLLFLAIAGWWVVGRFVSVDVPNLGWIVAAALITLGIIGVIGTIASRPNQEPEPVTNAGSDTLQLDRVDDDARPWGGDEPKPWDEDDAKPWAEDPSRRGEDPTP